MDIRKLKRFKRLDNTPHWLIGYEDRNRYDWLAFYADSKWNKYSRSGNPIDKDEMCKPGIIYKVVPYSNWPGKWDYGYKIVWARPDTIWQYEWRSNVKLKYILWNREYREYTNLINSK